MTIYILFTVPIIMFVIAGYLLTSIVKEQKTVERSNRWPIIKARVTHLNVVEKKRPTGGGKGVIIQSFYIPEIDYIFSNKGKDFEGHAHLRREWTPEIITTVGKTIEVHYNPENPAENTPGLEKPHLVDKICIVGILILVSFGIVINLITSLFNL